TTPAPPVLTAPVPERPYGGRCRSARTAAGAGAPVRPPVPERPYDRRYRAGPTAPSHRTTLPAP
ncbi:hypothetical protein, partial [Streptomyces venezuelae]|uniref:hypothetical protein n=1 Tax=Streptomyces venezuelae TaxID=54571 RepID=UPI00278C703A